MRTGHGARLRVQMNCQSRGGRSGMAMEMATKFNAGPNSKVPRMKTASIGESSKQRAGKHEIGQQRSVMSP